MPEPIVGEVDLDTSRYEQKLDRMDIRMERWKQQSEHAMVAMGLSATNAAIQVSGLGKEYKMLGAMMTGVGTVVNLLEMRERQQYMTRMLNNQALIAQNALETRTIAIKAAVTAGTMTQAAADIELAAAKNASTTADVMSKQVATMGGSTPMLIAAVASGIGIIASIYAATQMERGGAGTAKGGQMFIADEGEQYWFGGKNHDFPMPGGGGTQLIVQGNVYGIDDLNRILNERDRLQMISHGGKV